MVNAEKINACLSAINGFCHTFMNNPFKYLLERDIQCDLFATLRSEVDETVVVPSKIGDDYELDLIYAEYSKWIDLVCLNKDLILSMKEEDFSPRKGNHEEFIYHLPVLLSIELKYIKGKYRERQKFSSFLSDLEKLKSLSDTNNNSFILICFVQFEETFLYHKNNHPDLVFKEVTAIEELNKPYVISPDKIYQI